jgi:hypothetical protein
MVYPECIILLSTLFMLRRGKQPTPPTSITADDQQDEEDPPFVESMATVGVSIDKWELPQFAYSGTPRC